MLSSCASLTKSTGPTMRFPAFRNTAAMSKPLHYFVIIVLYSSIDVLAARSITSAFFSTLLVISESFSFILASFRPHIIMLKP